MISDQQKNLVRKAVETALETKNSPLFLVSQALCIGLSHDKDAHCVWFHGILGQLQSIVDNTREMPSDQTVASVIRSSLL